MSYLDNNASTPLDPRITDFIARTLPSLIGNPSSTHSYGRTVRALLSHAKDAAASVLHVSPRELTFTSGGTESVNMGIRGLITAQKKTGHIITSAVEHSCVIACCKLLETCGFTVTYLRPGAWGAVTPEAVQGAIRPDTCLIALMAVNNETGVKTDISSVASIAERHRIPLFVDAVALLGKEKFDITKGVSAMAFSGHKIHALQGVGLLFVRSGVKLQPLLVGGEHESGRRAGTENVLGILTMGKAFEFIATELPESSAWMLARRQQFEERLSSLMPDVLINGEGPRTVNVSNIAFPGIDGETLLMLLDRACIAASHGSACSSGALEPSRILLNMDLPPERVRSSIRFSFSRFTTEADIDHACTVIARECKALL
ncbi:MAG: cysteine desulfurase family protein [Parachlamydiaceae bacterium]